MQNDSNDTFPEEFTVEQLVEGVFKTESRPFYEPEEELPLDEHLALVNGEELFVECPHCRGNGYKVFGQSEPQRCGTCDGSGVIRDAVE